MREFRVSALLLASVLLVILSESKNGFAEALMSSLKKRSPRHQLFNIYVTNTINSRVRLKATPTSSSSASPSGGGNFHKNNPHWGRGGGGGGGSRGIPSRTARESAVNVEWEPMTELERRIEDGVNYEHLPGGSNKNQRNNKNGKHRTGRSGTDGNIDDDDENIPETRGVFCGYRYTNDEYNRLKSAHPIQ